MTFQCSPSDIREAPLLRSGNLDGSAARFAPGEQYTSIRGVVLSDGRANRRTTSYLPRIVRLRLQSFQDSPRNNRATDNRLPAMIPQSYGSDCTVAHRAKGGGHRNRPTSRGDLHKHPTRGGEPDAFGERSEAVRTPPNLPRAHVCRLRRLDQYGEQKRKHNY